MCSETDSETTKTTLWRPKSTQKNSMRPPNQKTTAQLFLESPAPSWSCLDPPVCPQKVPSGCVTKYRICGQRYSKNGRNSPPAPLQLFSNSIRLQTHFLTRIRWSTTSPASRYVRSETATPTNQTASKTLSSDSKTTLKRPHNSSWPLRCPQIDP